MTPEVLPRGIGGNAYTCVSYKRKVMQDVERLPRPRYTKCPRCGDTGGNHGDWDVEDPQGFSVYFIQCAICNTTSGMRVRDPPEYCLMCEGFGEEPIPGEFHHDGFEFNDGAKPPHDFNQANRLSTYAKIDRLVYLERDPRDVMVSLYFQVTKRFKDFFRYEEDISTFIRDDYFGAHKSASLP